MNKCHDCGCEITIKNKELENGVQLKYKHNNKDIYVFKCHECFKKNKGLNNFQSCETYSRVVGYLRPVQQWNDGKQQEFKERKNYEAI
jgi:anaerobic ribonucleoside-triphosphate reductase